MKASRSICLFAATAMLWSCKTAQIQESAFKNEVQGPLAVTEEAAIFRSSEPYKLTIEAPFKETFAKSEAGKKDERKVKFPATLRYVDAEGATQSAKADAKLRGQRSIGMPFKKFKLEMVKTDLPNFKEFAGADKLKVGTHCSDKPRFDNYGGFCGEVKAFREAWIYRVGAILGLTMARGRPANITYVDSSDNQATITRQAFFFEDTELLSKRLQGKELKELPGEISEHYDPKYVKDIDQTQLAKAKFFKIFTSDWDARISTEGNEWTGTESRTVPEFHIHNYDPFILKDGRVFIVPSDFDFSTFVILATTISNPAGGTSVTPLNETAVLGMDPIQKGIKQLGDAGFEEVIGDYKGKKEELLSELKGFPMDEEARKLWGVYLESFYKKLDEYVAKGASASLKR